MFVLQLDISLGDEGDSTDVGFEQGSAMHHQDPLHHQDAAQNRERNKLLLRKLNQTRERERGKEREQERERLHQLQSINNLLLDITPPSSSYLQDLSSSSQSDKNVSIDGRRTVLAEVSLSRYRLSAWTLGDINCPLSSLCTRRERDLGHVRAGSTAGIADGKPIHGRLFELS